MARRAQPVGTAIEPWQYGSLFGQTVLNVSIPRPLSTANRNYAWTTFESDRIPDEWVDALNGCYRAVFVPHPAVRRWFERSGVRAPVRTVSQGFKRLRRTRPLPGRSGRFWVGLVGYVPPRKNLDALIQAVKELDREGYPFSLSARLTLELTPELTESIARNDDLACFDLRFQRSLSDDELADWYSSLHAYVLPSSGEGWSMTPRESLYLGIPTIVSDIPVHRELLRSGYCVAIESSGRERAHYPFLGRTCGHWQRVSVAAIKRALVQVLDHYPDEKRRAQQGAAWIARRWHWERSLRRVVRLIRADGG